MGRTLRVLLLVACGVAGAWVGYWLGHLAGWSRNAEWPGQVGGGSGAIVLSIATSVLFVAAAGIVVFLLPERSVRRVLAAGSPAQATVLRVADTGGRSRGHGDARRQVSCELEVCPSGAEPFRAKATQFVSGELESALQPGATVAVRYDPAHRARVAIEGQVAGVA